MDVKKTCTNNFCRTEFPKMFQQKHLVVVSCELCAVYVLKQMDYSMIRMHFNILNAVICSHSLLPSQWPTVYKSGHVRRCELCSNRKLLNLLSSCGSDYTRSYFWLMSAVQMGHKRSVCVVCPGFCVKVCMHRMNLYQMKSFVCRVIL